MRVFLTGASGYVGRHVALQLLSEGHEVVGLARKATKRTRYSAEMKWHFAQLADFTAYWNELSTSDAVVHCAMDYTASGAENSDLDLEFVSRMSTFSGRFIYTGNLYSDRKKQKLPEEILQGSRHWRSIIEAQVLAATNHSVIRLGFVYGSDGGYLWDILSPGTVSMLSGTAIPKVYWPMIHVWDAARLYAQVLVSDRSGVFHAFDGFEVRAEQVIEAARAVYVSLGIAGSASSDYVDRLLESSIVTTNNHSLSLGWKPEHTSFLEIADDVYSEYAGQSSP